MTSNLQKILNLVQGKRLFIQTHDFPDPDAIASAFGLQKLLFYLGVDSHIVYKGKISRISATKMIEMFNIKLINYLDVPEMTKNDVIINVDSQVNNANIIELPPQKVACIDHHPTTVPCEEYKFKDVRIVGSCSSIIADYFIQNNDIVKLYPHTATALLYGLQMDTDNFRRGIKSFDIEIFGYLHKLADQNMLNELHNNQLEISDLDAYRMAINTVKLYNNIGFASIDFACVDGLIAAVSEFILSINKVDFSVVYSKRPDGLKFSIRSKKTNLNAGQITSTALDGIGSGGGHAAMAGGFIPIDNLNKINFDINEEIQNRFANAILFCQRLEDILNGKI